MGVEMKKNICKFILLCITIFNVFSRPGPQIVLYIDNYTQNILFIEYELINGDSEEERNYFWKKEISEQLITILDSLYNKSIKKILPNERRSIVEYYPTGRLADLDEKFGKIRQIPLMTLVKNTFKDFIIYSEDKNIVITLDSLEEENIVKDDYGKGVTYILKINEQNVPKE